MRCLARHKLNQVESCIVKQVRLFSTSVFYPPPILPDIEHSQLTIERTTTQKPKFSDKSKLLFGNTFTDHMLEVDWDNSNGWSAPKISPFKNLSLHPGSSSLHYALQAFEGMKAFKGGDGKIRLFRPNKNMQRLNSSHEYLFFPSFQEEELCESIKELVRLDSDWIPEGDGFSLYIRPTSISTCPMLGVAPASQVKVFVVLCPVGPYYPTGFDPVNLLADPKNIRAWPGGAGRFKVGGNYAPGIGIGAIASKRGFQQILWLFDDDYKITEVGTMNQFFYWQKADGSGNELVTAPLSMGTILPGVTRDSVLTLTRDWKEFEVSERVYTMHEVIDAIESGRMIEAFGTGTAAVVSPVNNIHFLDKDYAIPLDSSDPTAKIGKLTGAIWQAITDIQYGRVNHEWGVVL